MLRVAAFKNRNPIALLVLAKTRYFTLHKIFFDSARQNYSTVCWFAARLNWLTLAMSDGTFRT